MKKILSTVLLLSIIAGCQSKPEPTPPPVSQPMDASALQALRSTLGADVSVAGVSRVLPSDDFLALENANASEFSAGTPVSIIDSNQNTLAHGSVAAIVGDEVHVQFNVTGPRRPQIGDAAVAFPRR